VTIVTERMYRNHVIYIIPGSMDESEKVEAAVSITGPNGEDAGEWQMFGTEAGMFYYAEGEIDNALEKLEKD